MYDFMNYFSYVLNVYSCQENTLLYL